MKDWIPNFLSYRMEQNVIWLKGSKIIYTIWSNHFEQNEIALSDGFNLENLKKTFMLFSKKQTYQQSFRMI